MSVGSKFIDKHGRPVVGARVFVKSYHSLATIEAIDDGRGMKIKFDGESNHVTELEYEELDFDPKDLEVVGPPEIMTVDECPLCEETIRVKIK